MRWWWNLATLGWLIASCLIGKLKGKSTLHSKGTASLCQRRLSHFWAAVFFQYYAWTNIIMSVAPSSWTQVKLMVLLLLSLGFLLGVHLPSSLPPRLVLPVPGGSFTSGMNGQRGVTGLSAREVVGVAHPSGHVPALLGNNRTETQEVNSTPG